MKVGYIVKRFPRASETFIAQEILGLERLGVEIVIFALRPNDQAVRHAWLDEIRARVHTFEPVSFSTCWRSLQLDSRANPRTLPSIHAALLAAFDHPKRSGKRYLVESWWVASLCRELGVQHLHAHFANHPAFVAMLSHLVGDLPYSFTAHAKDIYLDGPDPELWSRQLEEAAFAITVSDSNRLHLGSFLGAGAMAKLGTLYNGVDLDRIRPVSGRRRADGTRVTLASRLIEKKGADLLVEAAPEILRRHPDVQVHIVGDGPQRQALETRVAALGVASSFRFRGMLPHQELIRVIAESDLFVLPSRIAANGDRDALPTVLLEAMAAGVPCVSTPVNGIPEIIDQGRTGLIVRENDPVGLAAAVDQLLADSTGRRRMGRASRLKVERRFDLRASTARLQSMFQNAIANYSARAENRPAGAAVI